TYAHHAGGPVGVVVVRRCKLLESQTLAVAPDDHRSRLGMTCDRVDADRHAKPRHLVEAPEIGKGLHIVAPGLFGQRHDARAAVARAPFWIEGHMAVARSRGENEKVDAPRL